MNIRRNIALAMLLAAGLGVQAQTEVTTFVPGSTLEGISCFPGDHKGRQDSDQAR